MLVLFNRKYELIAEVIQSIKVINGNVFKYISKESTDQPIPIFNIFRISMEIFNTLRKMCFKFWAQLRCKKVVGLMVVFQKVPEVVENRNKMSCGNTTDKL